MRPQPHDEVKENPALEAMWHVVCAIPRGQVATYGDVARAAGLPGRARQAGLALKVAPRELNVPWHRVVGAAALLFRRHRMRTGNKPGVCARKVCR